VRHDAGHNPTTQGRDAYQPEKTRFVSHALTHWTRVNMTRVREATPRTHAIQNCEDGNP
jgi:hypothetical protein